MNHEELTPFERFRLARYILKDTCSEMRLLLAAYKSSDDEIERQQLKKMMTKLRWYFNRQKAQYLRALGSLGFQD